MHMATAIYMLIVRLGQRLWQGHHRRSNVYSTEVDKFNLRCNMYLFVARVTKRDGKLMKLNTSNSPRIIREFTF
jgi:hypothetical protein